MKEFLIFGHRGSPGRFPENTVDSFEETLRAGADGFETDLRLLSDGAAVLFHDDELQGEEIESLTLAQCSERGATVQPLRDLARFAGRSTMILEVKRGGWEATLIDEVESWPDIIVASFDHSAIGELARRCVPFPLGLTLQGSIVELPSYAERLSATWCFPNFRYVSRTLVDALHARALRIVPWTPNRPGDWQRLRELGCDGIITDEPAVAVQWRDTG